MIMEGIADLDLIFQLYPAISVIRIWEQFEPVRMFNIKVMVFPVDYYEAFDTLYKEAKKKYPKTPSRAESSKLIKEIQSKHP